jgi:site-specific recombinase XerD
MTEQDCIQETSYSCGPGLAVRKERQPVTILPIELTVTKPDTPPPRFLNFPGTNSQTAWAPSKRRQILDHLSARIIDRGLPGADIAIEYLRNKYSKNMSPNTLHQAGVVVLSFLNFLDDSGTNIFKTTRHDISAFVEHEQDRGLKVNSVRSNLRGVYTFVNFLVEREILPQIIMNKKIQLKLPDLLPRAIPSEDMETLLSVIESIRNRALILLLLRTGLRIGELLDVKISDIILPERKILIYLGEKNYQGRVVYFGEDAESALKDWLEVRNKQKDYLFYSPSHDKITYAAVRKVMTILLKRAGLSNKGYSLHSLRHTFATDMLNAGLRLEVLQQLLGHQSVEVTMRYAKMSDTTRENEYFKAMAIIEQGGQHESHRVNSQLQAVFEEKKLLTSHNKKLSA